MFLSLPSSLSANNEKKMSSGEDKKFCLKKDYDQTNGYNRYINL